MNKVKKISFALIAISLCMGIFTACDPDDIDAFASGYRDGYYGSSRGLVVEGESQATEQDSSVSIAVAEETSETESLATSDSEVIE
ncbi:MAG: hypothetical protein J1F05_01980 [Muribaculaceae bacterium]|nr:hypothetical protein [Muribaculaceae bacterium]